MRVALGADSVPGSVFQVNYVHHAVSNDNAVGSTEALRHIFGHINALFNKDQRILTAGMCLGHALTDKGGIAFHVLLHSARILRICLHFGQFSQTGALVFSSQEQLTQPVSQRALGSIGAAGIRQALLQTGTFRAATPTERAGRPQ